MYFHQTVIPDLSSHIGIWINQNSFKAWKILFIPVYHQHAGICSYYKSHLIGNYKIITADKDFFI